MTSKAKPWDVVVRVTHSLTASLFLVNYWALDAGETLHRWAGYCLAGVVIVRLIWGFVGSERARLAIFFPTPSRLQYVLKTNEIKNIFRSQTKYPSHNPIAALMVIFLWSTLLLCALSGWAQGLDSLWGEIWPQTIHEIFADIVMIAVVVHIAAALTKIGINHQHDTFRQTRKKSSKTKR